MLKKYDLFIKVLFALLMGLSVASCDKPDEEPVPEYGVVPMYGVQTTVIDKHNPA